MQSDWNVVEPLILKGDDNYKLLENGVIISITRSLTAKGVVIFPVILGLWDSDTNTVEEVDLADERIQIFPNSYVYNTGKAYETYFATIFK